MFPKKAYFEILDLSVPLRWGQEYQDDGYVSNLTEYLIDLRCASARKITDEVRRAWIKKYDQDHKGESGITVKIEQSRLFWEEEEIRIAYLNLGNDIANVYHRGRQETDALRGLGHLKTLEETVGLSLSRARPERVLDIGGAHGLLKKGYTPRDIAFHDGGLSERMGWRMRNALNDFYPGSAKRMT